MRVRIGDHWFEPTLDAPIVVEFNSHDKQNIKKMGPGATRYAEFHPKDQRSVQEKMKFIDEGWDPKTAVHKTHIPPSKKMN